MFEQNASQPVEKKAKGFVFQQDGGDRPIPRLREAISVGAR
jgi:hypothetical protein